jgi:hypothetical protein
MIPALSVIILFLAFVAAILAVTSENAERLLWGSVLCSMGLGLAVELLSGGYYGILVTSVFLAVDTIIYLYFRTQNLIPARETKNPRANFVFQVFFVWIFLCVIALGGLGLVEFGALFSDSPGDGWGMHLLYEKIWGADWLLILIPILTLLGMVTGGFFLVRKER